MSNTTPKLEISWVDWLQRGEGVFHFAGKPGYGKSTLMKYLFKHAETQRHLTTWAGHGRLLMAQYFFWRVDSAQNRLEGLKRCILFTVIDKAPHLAEVLFPTYVRTSQGRKGHGNRRFRWTVTKFHQRLKFLSMAAARPWRLTRFISSSTAWTSSTT
jgi:hypothetical protein